MARTRAFDGAVLHPLALAVADSYMIKSQLSLLDVIEIGPGETPPQPWHADDEPRLLPGRPACAARACCRARLAPPPTRTDPRDLCRSSPFGPRDGTERPHGSA